MVGDWSTGTLSYFDSDTGALVSAAQRDLGVDLRRIVTMGDEEDEIAAEVRAELAKITDKPIGALIYTHNHADHVMGGLAFVPDGSAHAIPNPGAWFELTAPRFRFGSTAETTLPVITDRPGSGLADTAAGLRLSRQLGGLDFSVVAYTGLDPEVVDITNSVAEPNEQSILQPLRQFSITVNLSY